MNFKMKTEIFHILIVFWSGQALKIATQKDCIPSDADLDSKAPKCEFHMEPVSENVQASCPQKQVIRIQGDFNVLQIHCSASYPIDFHFDGISPTEAIRIQSHRTLKESSPGLEIILFHLDVQILSIWALYEHFKSVNNKIELRDEFKYSRTGEYQMKGFGENAMHMTSFYIFLEEPLAKPDFLQNDRTKWTKKNSSILLPCRPTHYLSNVTVNANYSEIESYDVKKGFILASDTLRKLTCEYSFNGEVVQLTFDTTRLQEEVSLGFIPPISNQAITININYDSRSAPQGMQPSLFNIYSSCAVIQRPFVLNVIGAPSFAHLKLTSEFVLPAFVDKSFGVEKAEEMNELNQELRTQGTPFRVGTVFCASGSMYDARIFGVGLNGVPIKFNFHQDMFKVARENSHIAIYMAIERKNSNELIYDGDEMEFECQVFTALFVPPVVWFVQLTDGSRHRGHVDYLTTLHDNQDTSRFKLKAAVNMSQVFCTASLWYKDFWRNTSRDISVLKTDKPKIVGGSDPEYKKVREDSTLVLTCRAKGTPLPEVFWRSQEADGTQTMLRPTPTYEEGEVTSNLVLTSPMEKTYFCVARIGNDEVVKPFHVQFSSGIGVWAILSICLAVALAAAVPTFFYYRFFRKQKPLGLNRYEIAEFVSGEMRDSQRASTNEYAHEFAHLCPYDKSYEIDATRFQIDKTSFLGKGAFGVVLKGLVDGVPAAVKMLSKNAEKPQLKALLCEVKIHIHLGDHDHVVRFLGANTKDLRKGSVRMFVELCSLGNLENYLRTNKGTFLCKGRKLSVTRQTIVMQDLINWSLQIASGMDHLSSKKVIHGDLATRNVLLDDNRVAKITDFGLSRQFEAYAAYVKKQLEPLPWRWMALESLQHLTFSSKSDVWAYAVTLWEVFTLGEIPYVGMSWNLSFVNELEEGLRLPKPRHAPEDLHRKVMLACWNNRPELRPSFSDIIGMAMHIFGVQDESSEEPPILLPKPHMQAE